MNVTIDEFFEEANILITGGTGFIGKVLIEKLLRSQSNINKLYLLIRPKRGKAVEDRINKDIFAQPIFEDLKRTQPDFMKKIVIIPGDILKPQLDLSKEDTALIQNEVSIVYNIAASVNMNARLKNNVKHNIRSVLELLKLCRGMKVLKSVVIVSTAYSNCNHEIIEEKIYTSSLSPKFVLDLCDEVDDKVLENITPMILDGHPNSYTFSKAIMEDMLQNYKDLPIVVFRPAVVTPAYHEPLVGWVDNYYGVVGMTFATAVGLLRVISMNETSQANVVPVDLCTNALICSAWHGTQNRLKNDMVIPVYNYSCDKVKTTWNNLLTKMTNNKVKIYTGLWKPICIITSDFYKYYVLRFLLHFLPALFIDIFLVLSRKKFRLNKTYNKRIYPFAKVIRFFAFNSWTIQENNTEAMWKDISEKERERYFFDPTKVDMNKVATDILIGIKVYLLHEKLEDNWKAVRKQQILKVIHYSLVLVIFMGMLWISYRLIRFLGV